MTRIVFYTRDALEILRYISLDIIKAGTIWVEAWASESDLQTFKSNGWWFDKA